MKLKQMTLNSLAGGFIGVVSCVIFTSVTGIVIPGWAVVPIVVPFSLFCIYWGEK